MHRLRGYDLYIASRLPSPRGVRVASWAQGHYFLEDFKVAVPARGAGCIFLFLTFLIIEFNVAVPARGAGCIKGTFTNIGWTTDRCRPREGCGLHPALLILAFGMGVRLPSPRGVRVASAKGYKPVSAHLSVPYNPQAQYNTRTAKNARRFVPVIQKTRV